MQQNMDFPQIRMRHILDSKIYLREGDDKFRRKDFKGSFYMYNIAIKINPNYYQAYIQKGKLFNQQGILFCEQKQFDEAIKQFDKAIQINSKDKQVYLHKGNAYSEQRDFQKALDFYDIALRVDYQDHEIYIQKGKCLICFGKLEKALLSFSEGLRYLMKNQTQQKIENLKEFSLQNLNQDYQECGQYKINILDKSLNQLIKYQLTFLTFNKNADILADINIGNLFFSQKKYKEASLMYDQLKKLNQCEYYLGKVKTLIAQGKVKQAQQLFKESTKYDWAKTQYESLGSNFIQFIRNYEESLIIYNMLEILNSRECSVGKGLYSLLFKVKTLIALGQKEKAIQAFNICTKDRVYFYDYENIGKKFFQEKQYDQAFIVYDLLILLDPSEGYPLKAKKLIELGKIKEAFEELNEGAKYQRTHFEYIKIGDKFISENKYEEAMTVYDIIIKFDPEYGYVIKGKYLIKLGQISEAFEILQQGVKYQRKDYDYQQIGDDFFKQKRYEEALIMYDILIQLNNLEGYFGKAIIFNAQGRPQKVKEMLTQLLNQYVFQSCEYGLIQFKSNLINRLRVSQNYEIALIVYDLFIELDPSQICNYLNKGQLKYKQSTIAKTLISLGETEQGVQILTENLNQNSNQIHQYKDIGDRFIDNKQYEEALIIYNIIVEHNPSDISVYLKKLMILTILEKKKQAFEAFSECIKIHPELVYYQRIGEQFIYDKKYESASILYDMIITQLNPLEGYKGKILALIGLGQVEQAMILLAECIQKLNVDLIEKLPNLKYLLLMNNKLQSTQINNQYFYSYLTYPWQYHNVLILQEMGIYNYNIYYDHYDNQYEKYDLVDDYFFIQLGSFLGDYK